MNTDEPLPFEGACTCRSVRYRMTTKPLFVHCCHCRWCQRETGSSFALNAMIEADRVALLQGEVEVVNKKKWGQVLHFNISLPKPLAWPAPYALNSPVRPTRLLAWKPSRRQRHR